MWPKNDIWFNMMSEIFIQLIQQCNRKKPKYHCLPFLERRESSDECDRLFPVLWGSSTA